MHEYKRLVEAAANIDPRIHLLVLLGGSAGLRRGEIMSLKWTDLDIKRRSIHVQRSIWRGAHPVHRVTSTSKLRRRRLAQSTRESGA